MPRNLQTSRRWAYTLTETLVTVAVLVIVLGMMVSLARVVRARSARMVTQEFSSSSTRR